MSDREALKKIIYTAAPNQFELSRRLPLPIHPRSSRQNSGSNFGLGKFKDGKTEKWLPGESKKII